MRGPRASLTGWPGELSAIRAEPGRQDMDAAEGGKVEETADS